jgi:hypothetical protein
MRRFVMWFGSWHPVAHGAAVIVVGIGVALALTAHVPADASIPVPHARWLAQCDAFTVDAAAGITVERVRVRPGRVTALLRAGKRRGWLQAHKLGALNGKAVWAVRGPAALMAAMASSPSCSGSNGRVVAWSAVKDLPAPVLAQIAQWFTCCGSATLAGREFREWPCAWQLAASPQFRPALAVDRLDGYGPGVVGSTGACAEYTEDIP